MQIVLTSFYDRQNARVVNVTPQEPLPVSFPSGSVVSVQPTHSRMVPIQVPADELSIQLDQTTPRHEADIYVVPGGSEPVWLRGIMLIASQPCSVRLLYAGDGVNFSPITGWIPLVEGAGWSHQFDTMMTMVSGSRLRLVVERYSRTSSNTTSVSGLYLGGYLLVK